MEFLFSWTEVCGWQIAIDHLLYETDFRLYPKTFKNKFNTIQEE